MTGKTPSKTTIISIVLLLTAISVWLLPSQLIAETMSQKMMRLARQRKTGVKESPPKQLDEEDITEQPKDIMPTPPYSPPVKPKPVAAKTVSPATSMNRPAPDKVSMLLPQETLFCLRINDIDNALGKTDQFLTSISPMPMGLTMLARMQMAGILADPMLTNVNMRGTLALFAFPIENSTGSGINPLKNIAIAALLPVTDYNTFISANPAISPPDPDGISTVTSPGSPLGNTAMIASPNKQFAIITSAGNAAKLLAVKSAMQSSSLASSLDDEELTTAKTAPLWVYVNIARTFKLFAPMIEQGLSGLEAGFKQLEATTGGQSQPFIAGQIFGMYRQVIDRMTTQLDHISIAVTPSPEAIKFTTVVSAVKGSDMRQLLHGQTEERTENPLLGYLEDGAFMNVISNIDLSGTQSFVDKGIEILISIFGKDLTPQQIDEIKTLTQNSIAVMGTHSVQTHHIDIGSTPSFISKTVMQVNDGQKYSDAMKNIYTSMNSGALKHLYKGLDMDISADIHGSENYKGIAIESAKMKFASTDAASPQGQAINSMFSDGINVRWAVVKQFAINVTGPNADAEIREVIDNILTGSKPAVASEIQTAIKLLPEAANGDLLVTYNYVRIFRILGSMAITSPTGQEIKFPQIDVPTTSNLILGANVGNGNMTLYTVLPKTHLIELIAVFKQLSQKMMQQQGTQAFPQPQPGMQP